MADQPKPKLERRKGTNIGRQNNNNKDEKEGKVVLIF
jgi:hypothetical protein